jgi:hypothetical protein
MTNKKRGRPARFKATDLKEAGYTFKQDILTNQEKEWQEHGIPVEGKPNQRTPAPDWLYYFKMIGGVEVKVYLVGKDLYYNGVRLKNKEQLPLIEKDAQDQAKYGKLQEMMKDTEPLEIAQAFTPAAKPEHPAIGTIELVGGPLDGQFVTWNNKLPFYMVQYTPPQLKAQHGGTTPPVKTVIAARYKRDKEDHTKYNIESNIH